MGNFKITVTATVVGESDNRYYFGFWLNVSAIKWNQKLRVRDQLQGTKVGLDYI